jgi:hypothetical protein
MHRDREREAGADERLTALMREWKDIEPGAGFDAAVRARVRSGASPESAEAAERGWWWIRVLPEPTWATALAAALAVVLGTLAGAAGPARVGRQTPEPLFHPQTLAGSYLSAVTGGAR